MNIWDDLVRNILFQNKNDIILPAQQTFYPSFIYKNPSGMDTFLASFHYEPDMYFDFLPDSYLGANLFVTFALFHRLSKKQTATIFFTTPLYSINSLFVLNTIIENGQLACMMAKNQTRFLQATKGISPTADSLFFHYLSEYSESSENYLIGTYENTKYRTIFHRNDYPVQQMNISYRPRHSKRNEAWMSFEIANYRSQYDSEKDIVIKPPAISPEKASLYIALPQYEFICLIQKLKNDLYQWYEALLAHSNKS